VSVLPRRTLRATGHWRLVSADLGWDLHGATGGSQGAP